jgi:hypothetical protein
VTAGRRGVPRAVGAAWCRGDSDPRADSVRLHSSPELGRNPVAKLAPAEVQSLLNAKRGAKLSPRRVAMAGATVVPDLCARDPLPRTQR